MKKFFYRAMLTALLFTAPIVFVVMLVYNHRKELWDDLIEFYSLAPIAIKKGIVP